jgi:nucleotide-binding universal stress UspA family protein
MKILLAADGSAYTRKAARQLAKYTTFLSTHPEVHLLHVHAPLPYPRAMAVVGKDAVEKYQREESEKALAVAEKELKKAGIPYTAHWMAGDVAEAIAEYVHRHDIDMIVMGSHGHTALKNLALGSATTKVIATVKVPVLIVR